MGPRRTSEWVAFGRATSTSTIWLNTTRWHLNALQQARCCTALPMRSPLEIWPWQSSRLVGARGRTESLSLMEMYTRGAGGGVSLSVNKRLASKKIRKVVNWTPTRYDILEDVEHGSCAV